MTITHEYRLYEHPVLPTRIVKRGFCWPALIVGPAWLLLKRLWIPTAVLIAIAVVAYYLNHNNLYSNNDFSDGLILNVCIVMPDGTWISNYQGHAAGVTDYDCWVRTQNIDILILVLAQLIVALLANLLWEQDLVRRGYTLNRSFRARSIDDARAILAREADE